jgi:hypothetical protein
MSPALRPILRDLERIKTAFDFDQHGLGEKLMDTAVDTIERLMDNEEDPNGIPWDELSESYVKQKARINPGAPMAVLHDHMKQRHQLEGERRITAREAVMVYGTDDRARDEATWFQEGNSATGQPPRRFYELGYEAQARLDQACRDHLDRIIKGRP